MPMNSHLALLAIAAAQLSAVATAAPNQWTTPFQAGRPDLIRDQLKSLPKSRCDRTDPYAKCTFTTRVDYDGNGSLELVRMVEGRNTSAIVVEFSRNSKKRPLTIASFKGRWNGSCYIERDRNDRTSVAFTCPEASAATFKMRRGKPAALWVGD